MRKNIRKHLSAILTASTITSVFTAVPNQAYAYTVNANNNAYYAEVSSIAANLTANFKDETERKCCYSAMMTGVFGEHYNDWDFRRERNDLICALDENMSCDLLQCFIGMNGMVKYVILNDGKHYYCPVNKIELNQDAINERNYASLKSIYQAAEMLKAQTEGMNVTDKARHIHDFMVSKYRVGNENELNEHGALWMEASGIGICSAYMTMFLILGRYCGLDVSGVVYRTDTGSLHTYNTLTLENGETRYIDVMWDDVVGGYVFFMETAEQTIISHPGM